MKFTKISILFPTYNEQENLPLLYKRLSSTVNYLSEYNFEFIFIDDCSSDKTPIEINNLRERDKRVHHLRFSRNCGSHAAVAAGLSFCNGDLAIVLAADLQDPPEIIPSLIEQWKKGYKIVWGSRKKRKGEKLITLAMSRLYYFLMNRYAEVKQLPAGADVFLVDRIVIDAYNKSPEKNTSVTMLIAWLGFSQTYITYVKESRYAGTSKWTTSKRFKLFFDSLISFSYVPLRFMSLMGAISGFLGLLYGLVVLVNALRGNPIQGWSSLMIVVLLIGGFQMGMMGMLGEYLWRTYDETRGRPRYVIEKNTLLEGASCNCDGKKHNDDEKL